MQNEMFDAVGGAVGIQEDPAPLKKPDSATQEAAPAQEDVRRLYDPEALAKEPPVPGTRPALAPQIQRSIPTPMRTNSRGIIIGETFEEQWRIAKAYCESGLLPKQFDTPEKVLTAHQYVLQLGFPAPLVALRQTMVLNGTPSIFGDLPLALCRMSPKYVEHDEWWTYKDGTKYDPEKPRDEIVYAAICRVVTLLPSGKEKVTIRRWSYEDSKDAGIWDRKGRDGSDSMHKKYPARMFQMRSRTWSLKDALPEVLSGVSIAEYDHDILPEKMTFDVTAQTSVASPSEQIKQAMPAQPAAAPPPAQTPPQPQGGK